jgi:hypothetical protein
MADNPFDPKRNSLASLVSGLQNPPAQNTSPFFGLLSGVPTQPVQPTLLSGLGMLSDTPSGRLADLVAPPPAPGIGLFAPFKPSVKRKVFFSFHYDDIMRVNVVRNAWKIDHPDNSLMRSFQDSSLWESRKRESDDALKRLIREGVEYTSAVCVLVGSETWLRRWVKYEIARAIIDRRGLLAVHLNSIRHHHTRTAHTRGINPLECLAVGKVQQTLLGTPKYYLFEKQLVPNGLAGNVWGWCRYSDHTSAVSLPAWLADPQPGYVTPLSYGTMVYDYIADNGHQNIGGWVDKAAQAAGR